MAITDSMQMGSSPGKQPRTYMCEGLINPDCKNKGVHRIIWPVPIGIGVVTRPTVYCDECGHELALVQKN